MKKIAKVFRQDDPHAHAAAEFMNDGPMQLWQGVLFRQRPDQTFESISPHVQQWTGLDPQQSLQAIHPDDHAKSNSDTATFRLRHARTCQITWVEQRRRAIPTGYEGYWENITDRMRLTQELAQAHRRATVGLATQRLIHDFNNLLTGILSLSDAYLLRLKADNPAQEGLQLINQNARQAADIVHQIGALSREASGSRSYQNLAQVAATAADMLRRVMPKYSVLKVDCARESIPVYVDAAELKHMILALGLALTPPIHVEVASEHNEARLVIKGAVADHSRAIVLAEAFAQRNDVRFDCSLRCPQSGASDAAADTTYGFRFPESNFTEDEQRKRSILLVAAANEDAFPVAELMRANGYDVVVGPENLKSSADYRFDATVQVSTPSGSLSGDTDVVLRKEMNDEQTLAALRDFFES